MEKIGKLAFFLSIAGGFLALFLINKGYEKHKYDLIRLNALKTNQATLNQEANKKAFLTTVPPQTKIKEFTILVSERGFVPSEITAQKGDTVVINLKSLGYYNFSIKKLGIHSELLTTNEKGRFAFAATQSGVFEIISDTNIHYSKPVIGKMIIQ